MHYLIDGYNFLFCIEGFKGPSLEKKRESFLAILNDQLANFKPSVSIIFDSSEQIQPYPQSMSLEHLTVFFAPKDQTADNYIVEMVEIHKNPKNLTVVTRDTGLARQCQHLGAQTLSIEGFISLLIKKKKKKQDQKPYYSESIAEVNRLLKEFEKRLKND